MLVRAPAACPHRPLGDQVTAEQLLYPSPASALAEENHLEHFEFVGQVLGKALYESVLVEPQFAGFFLNKLLGKQNPPDDLRSLDPDLYRQLMSIKTHMVRSPLPRAVRAALTMRPFCTRALAQGDMSELGLTFDVTTSDFGETRVIPLLPRGQEIEVTKENRLLYVALVANYKLNRQLAPQCSAFLRGMHAIVPQTWLKLFAQVRRAACARAHAP